LVLIFFIQIIAHYTL